MEPGQPSRTAMSAAHARAVHQTADAPPVFPDPLAVRVAPAAAPGRAMPREVRLFMALRHRIAEDALAAAVAAGTRQAVLLGAGLDTFAHRNPHPGLRVFEVDHPDTQAWKRKRLADAGIPVPETVVHVPVDFAAGTLGAALADAGFTPGAPAFFAWLGVVPYLTRSAILATLRFVAGLDARTEIVFDYNLPPAELPAERRAVLAALAAAMAKAGEPWRSYFTPEKLARDLADAGFDAIEDLAWTACLERYGLDAALPDLFGGRIVRAVAD
ncbi:class I SAM-dependent methyltransferase [Actinomadura rayongensis]|uniref:S-adenosyl-L-methionine-dependent methyltransferase n=1 Tax=Actinomadura rayongensis TaxID=1429076 RepID=A0A6I4WHU0_9ACTN|nr:class I SAM-dependent methyltransferase [Actinomadura rayongensis]MXQ67895.1 SAM-dependent methyltransferase [Actinomadura rayongensis]